MLPAPGANDVWGKTINDGINQLSGLRPPPFIEGVSFFDLDTNANVFNFPGKWVNTEHRRLLIIQNLGANSFQVAYKNTNSADYNAPSWTGATTVPATGTPQLVIAENTLTVFIRPVTSGTAISGAIYRAIGN